MSAFNLAACADSSNKEEGAQEAKRTMGQGTKAGANLPKGVVATSEGRYAFTATTCAVSMEDGAIDAEISGPGTDADGKPIFVDFSSVGQELTIHLGVDKPFSSATHYLRGGKYVTRPFSVTLENRNISVTELELATDDGSIIDRHAGFQVDCG